MITPKEEKANDETLKLLKSIRDFYNNKSNTIEDSDNILIKYLKDPNIIKNNKKENASLFIKELLNQINNGNNIILPFIDPCYDLIEAYIDSDIDTINENKLIEYDMDSQYKQIFEQLIKNSFINRKILIPIYAYFTELYSSGREVSQSDNRLDKIPKIINLWKLFYNNDNKQINSSSSFCFMGSGLEIFGYNFLPENYYLKVTINFLNNSFFKYNNSLEVALNKSKASENNITKITSIYFNIRPKRGYIEINADTSTGSAGYLELNNKSITILNNFYGEINSIEISIIKETFKNLEETIYEKKIKPFPIKNSGILFSNKFDFYLDKDTYYNDKKIELRLTNKNLVKSNYINYKEGISNIIDYFGGPKQLLPFLNIINGLHRNKEISKIHNIEKDIFLINFVENILLIFFNYLIIAEEKIKINIYKYWNFIIYIINKIEPIKSEKNKINLKKFNSPDFKKDKLLSLIYNLLKYINHKIEEYEFFEMVKAMFFDMKKGINNYFNLFGKTNCQLYRNIMKQMFIYNRLWSKQYLFFKNVNNCFINKIDNNLKVKFKRLNYYAKNFQQPLIYPVLEINNYYPEFKNLKKSNIKNLYKKPEDELLNYDFSLDDFNILNENFLVKYIDKNEIVEGINCCLIKKMYHVKGKIKIDKLDDDSFDSIFFLSNNNETDGKCNKKIDNQKKNSYNSHLCYGSVFSCLKKDKNRLIYIPRDNIMFAILRVYYYRVSGLEIFTSNNKSYYFNFWEESILDTNNAIIEYFNKHFNKMECDNKNIVWYNSSYSEVLRPLFINKRFYEWNDRIYFYSNFDKLMIINLFSNRSLNDLSQYPIFPMLYNELKEIEHPRDMNEPIGFQEVSNDSKERKKLIIDSYNYEDGEEEDEESKFYFTIFPSNITYTCNYLIRVVPYSFISIEYQGDGFDDPNRLFFSINYTLRNTLNQRSDLRELIPEIFYFPPLFYNENELQLNKTSDGHEIDCVSIQDWNEDPLRKYIFIRDIRNSLEKEENINLWIDLMFNKKREYNENNERYYNKNSIINFENNPDILNDDLAMQSFDFGVLPFKIFNEKLFPKNPKITENLEKEICKYNEDKFIDEHIYCLCEEKYSFICKGKNFIDNKYLEIINNIKKHNTDWLYKFFVQKFNNNQEEYNNNLYLFIGDVFGNLYVYNKNCKVQTINNNYKEIKEKNLDKYYLEKIKNGEFNLMKILRDHSNEITYIDYNPRLNLVVDYALDGYINIYTMPTLKLIHVIQTKDFGIKEQINFLILISNPFPMITCICKQNLFVFDINGKLINKQDFYTGIRLGFGIDKNCGLFNDCISFKFENDNNNNKEVKIDLFVKNTKK